jgi:hypothetical protein
MVPHCGRNLSNGLCVLLRAWQLLRVCYDPRIKKPTTRFTIELAPRLVVITPFPSQILPRKPDAQEMANLRGGHGCVWISRLLFLDEAVALADSTQRLINAAVIGN